MWDEYPFLTETEVRSALGRFLFKGDTVFRTLREMSGGERARIALLKLMLKGSNFLLLDEPTNHLDTSFREQLENALQQFDGTMLVISHDRYFINKLADRILVLSDNGVTEYLGGYDYYIEKSGQTFNKSIFSSFDKKGEKIQKQNDYNIKKQKQSDLRKAKTRLKKCEDEIAETEQEIEQTQSLLEEPETASDYENILIHTNKLNELNEKLEMLYTQWEEASQQLEMLTNE